MSTEASRLVNNQIEHLQEDARSYFERSDTAHLHSLLFSAGGKFLRPRLAIACSGYGEAQGRRVEWELVRRAALAIELAHMGTLYHDDIVDRSATRRGVPAVHCRLGTRAAAIGGAHLLARANALVARLPDPLPRRWGIASSRIADGQLREIEQVGSFDLAVDSYLSIARRKTATLFELAAFFGGFLGGVPATDLAVLGRFAGHLGLAFQLFDDLHDFVSEPATHRYAGSDLRERVYTLPVLYGCARSDPAGARLRQLLRDDGRPVREDEINIILDLLASTGAFAAAARRASEERDLARVSLLRLRGVTERESFERLLDLVAPPRIPDRGLEKVT